MTDETRNQIRSEAGRNPLSIGLRWLARAFFVAALLAAGYGLWLRPSRTPEAPVAALRKGPVTIDWSREPFQEWTSVEDGINLKYPARFDATRGFGRFTSRDVAGGILETDVVAFRSAEPRAVITVACYKAPQPLSWERWIGLAREPLKPPADSKAASLFSGEFGGSAKTYRVIRVDGRPALAVSAKGGVKYPARGNDQWELWRFESRLFAEGDTAARITAGVHADQYDGAREGLERSLASFRWTPPAR